MLELQQRAAGGLVYSTIMKHLHGHFHTVAAFVSSEVQMNTGVPSKVLAAASCLPVVGGLASGLSKCVALVHQKRG